jgi:ABC-type nickel/cobalt efflux system permease component RcnA
MNLAFNLEIAFGLWFFALLLGIKHSFDADHLVAVSGFLSNASSTKRSTTLSVSWALGHMGTASVLTIILFTFKETLLKEIISRMEYLVAFMLIAIAVLTFAWEFDILHFHRHGHNHDKKPEQTEEHSHVHIHLPKLNEHGSMVGIGFIHGIASNDELLLLFTLTLGISSLIGILIGVFFFTIGVILGMIVYGWIIKFPNQKFGQKRVSRIINTTIASITLVYGVYLLLGLEGLNIIEILASFFE